MFLLKILIKVRLYDYVIHCYNPCAIVVCDEYSFTSSVLTHYCNERGIEHIDCMHGEKLYYIRDSFFHYNRCYVWDYYYKELLLSLRAEPNQFIISIPPSLRFENTESEKIYDYTYYLGGEEKEGLKRILNCLNDLNNSNNHIAIRPHPRYTNLDELQEMILGTTIEIEDCGAISIEESLLRTRNAISVYSTVLNQAYSNGINIVLDDISDPFKFEKLCDMQYIMLHKKHVLLSQVMGGKE